MHNNHLVTAGTFSKSPRMFGFDKSVFATGIKGESMTSRVYIGGKPVVDWISGLGANLMGYGDENFIDHVYKQLGQSSYSIIHELEYIVAEKLSNKIGSRIPWKHAVNDLRVRFSKTGTDATTSAVRLARAITGKENIVSVGYHGWSSEFIAGDYPALGIPVNHKQHIRSVRFNDLDDAISMSRHGLAAIIIEQPPQEPHKGYYQEIRRICNEHNALFIMDEVVTNLRYGIGGACERYGIEPDLVCLGKGLGNGIPISALMGHKDHMNWFKIQSPPFCSSTFWGETLGLAAAEYVLDNFTNEDVGHIHFLGNELINGLADIGWDVIGTPSRSLLQFNNNYERAFFIHGMYNNGFLMNRPNFPNLAHTFQDVTDTVNASRIVKENLNGLTFDELRNLISQDNLPFVLFDNR